MNATEKNETTLGLDVGTSRIVIARPGEEGVDCRAELNGFVTVPYTKLAEKAVRREGVPSKLAGDRIIIYGNESERFADLLNAEVRRPMTRGLLNPGEPDGAQLIREIVASLVAPASGGKLCFTVPAAPLGSEENVTYHEAALREILSGLGFDASSISEGLAVVYAEMESSNYSGIGVSCGGGLCNVCLAYLSVPVLTFSIPKAGDFIDANAAAVTAERANRVRMFKEESFHINGSYPDKIQQALAVYYEEMIRTLAEEMTHAFSRARSIPKLARPVPLVLSGGSVMPAGFRERFEKVLSESGFPIPLSEVRLAADPRTSAAKGALVAALTQDAS
jgi:hypothetical protein